MANTSRNVVVGLFAVASAIGLIACSGSADSDVGGEATAQDQSLLKEGACFSEHLGDATSCKDPGTWKDYAAKACASRGLDVAQLEFGAACKGGFSEAKYSCCKSAPKPIPSPKPDPIACFGDVQGGPTSCKPVELWKQYADSACKAKGEQIVAIDFAEECDKNGSFRWVKYECCDATKPLPPPPVDDCKYEILGDDGKSCKDDGAWKSAAIALCASQKLEFADASLGATCGKGMSTAVKVKCCGAGVKPPPPPPAPPPPKPVDACEDHYVGPADGKGCLDSSTWKQYAADTCAKQGLKVGTIGFPDLKCNATGSTNEFKFTCCK